MGKTSELGSIDPQVVAEEENKGRMWFSIYNVVRSYEELFEKAVKEKGNLEPYLQQLANYDAREIAECRSSLSLSEDIAIKALKTGMLSELSEKGIKKKIKDFLTPEKVKNHGRPIYDQDAINSRVDVEIKDLKEKFWYCAYELNVRLNNHVSTTNIAK